MRGIVLSILTVIGLFCVVWGCNEQSRENVERSNTGAGKETMKNGSGSVKTGGERPGKGRTTAGEQPGTNGIDRAQKNFLRPIPRIRTDIDKDDEEGKGQEKATPIPNRPGKHPQSPGQSGEGIVLFHQERRNGGWESVSWSNANECRIINETGAGLRIECKKGKNDKGGIKYSFGAPVSLLPYDVVKVDASIIKESESASEVKLAVGVKSDSYYESPPVKIDGGGKATLEFDLLKPHYKTAPDWEYNSSIQKRGKIRGVYLLVYYDGSSCLDLCNISFSRKDTGR